MFSRDSGVVQDNVRVGLLTNGIRTFANAKVFPLLLARQGDKPPNHRRFPFVGYQDRPAGGGMRSRLTRCSLMWNVRFQTRFHRNSRRPRLISGPLAVRADFPGIFYLMSVRAKLCHRVLAPWS